MVDCPNAKKGPLFQFFFSTKHFCNVPTCSFQQNLFLVGLVTVSQRSMPSKCARLSTPQKWPTVSHFFQPSISVIHRPVAFARTCFRSNLVTVARRSRPSNCAGLSAPPKKGPLFQIFFNPAFLQCPDVQLSPKPVFDRFGHTSSEIEALQVCSTIRPPPPPRKGPLFHIFFNQGFLYCPDIQLSPEPVFGEFDHNSSEIQALQVCSNYPPQKKGPLFHIFFSQAWS